ncbi:unnamed protein product, partial [Iphiclides podalirius]
MAAEVNRGGGPVTPRTRPHARGDAAKSCKRRIRCHLVGLGRQLGRFVSSHHLTRAKGMRRPCEPTNGILGMDAPADNSSPLAAHSSRRDERNPNNQLIAERRRANGSVFDQLLSFVTPKPPDLTCAARNRPGRYPSSDNGSNRLLRSGEDAAFRRSPMLSRFVNRADV